MKKAIILGYNTPTEYKTDYKVNTDHFTINKMVEFFNTEFCFIDNSTMFEQSFKEDARKANYIVSHPFMDGCTIHVSEYYGAIKYNPNEDVDKLVELTDGEVRYHLLQAAQKNTKFYFPSYHSSLSLLLFYLVWNDYREIELIGCEIKPASQEDKVKCDYANNHIYRLITFIQELGIEVNILE